MGDAGPEVGEERAVVLLERRDALEYPLPLGGAGRLAPAQAPSRLDAAPRVVLRRERPVVVALGVALLQMDDGRPRPEPAQPRVGVALIPARAGNAVMADVEAQL